MNGYISVQMAAERWGVTMRQVQSWCKGGKVDGAYMLSRVWLIPENAPRPVPKRNRKHDKV